MKIIIRCHLIFIGLILTFSVLSLSFGAEPKEFVAYSDKQTIDIEKVNLQLMEIYLLRDVKPILEISKHARELCLLKVNQNHQELMENGRIRDFERHVDLIRYTTDIGNLKDCVISERPDSMSIEIRPGYDIGFCLSRLLYLVTDQEQKKDFHLFVTWGQDGHIDREFIVDSRDRKKTYTQLGVEVTWPEMPVKLDPGKFTSARETRAIEDEYQLVNTYRDIILASVKIVEYREFKMEYYGSIIDEKQNSRIDFRMYCKTGIVGGFHVRSLDKDNPYELHVQYRPFIIREKVDNKNVLKIHCDDDNMVKYMTFYDEPKDDSL